jgi:hypothetical protein
MKAVERKSRSIPEQPDSAVGRLSVTYHVRGLRTLGSVFHVKRYGLALGEDFEAFSLDRREVYENILAAVFRRYETEPLGFVEPLDRTCRHLELPLEIKIKNDQSQFSIHQNTGIINMNL